MKKILFVASESVPFIKTGGLADVVGTLPKTFDKDEYDVRVVLPNYTCIPNKFRDAMTDISSFYMDLSWRTQYVGIKELVYDGVTFYFIDNLYYFTGNKPYGDMYLDIEKFCYFSKAALSILPVIDFKPDIIHCHDWQAGLVPVFLKTAFANQNFYRNIKTVMTIHNLRFQGITDSGRMMDLTGLHSDLFTEDKMGTNGNGNMLKGGITYADKVTTVSETYAQEIQTPFFGEQLDPLLRYRKEDLFGIVNGIDYDSYNPLTDKQIAACYDKETVVQVKRENKMDLQKEVGLPIDPDKFVIGIISRLTDQKGLDLVDRVMNEICSEDLQFVVLGTGDPKYENMFRYYASQYPDKVSSNILYSDALSKKIYAGADALMVPSLFEPCGLTQLMALRYGTVPIVRETGGLKDTVEAYDEYAKTGNGFSFSNYNAHEMLYTIQYAVKVYYETPEDWNGIVQRGMEMDYSWDHSAKEYEELYHLM